jgi:hypothetical protein
MDQQTEHGKPTERYAYYRRCQEFRRNGEQCKAPAEKGERICHAHAGQRAMAERREVERRVVLAAAAAKMCCSVADLLTSFNGIQVTLAAAAQALIAGRIDCKTAGRLLWDLQRMAKLLRVAENILPQISAYERRSKRVEVTKEMVLAANECESTRIIKSAMVVFPGNQWSNGPPGWARAA